MARPPSVTNVRPSVKWSTPCHAGSPDEPGVVGFNVCANSAWAARTAITIAALTLGRGVALILMGMVDLSRERRSMHLFDQLLEFGRRSQLFERRIVGRF